MSKISNSTKREKKRKKNQTPRKELKDRVILKSPRASASKRPSATPRIHDRAGQRSPQTSPTHPSEIIPEMNSTLQPHARTPGESNC